MDLLIFLHVPTYSLMNLSSITAITPKLLKKYSFGKIMTGGQYRYCKNGHDLHVWVMNSARRPIGQVFALWKTAKITKLEAHLNQLLVSIIPLRYGS